MQVVFAQQCQSRCNLMTRFKHFTCFPDRTCHLQDIVARRICNIDMPPGVRGRSDLFRPKKCGVSDPLEGLTAGVRSPRARPSVLHCSPRPVSLHLVTLTAAARCRPHHTRGELLRVDGCLRGRCYRVLVACPDGQTPSSDTSHDVHAASRPLV